MSLRHSSARRRDQPESTIALINIVFLLLIFFLIAGTLSAPRDKGIELAESNAFDPAALSPAAIYIDRAGTIRVAGTVHPPASAVASAETLAPDGAALWIVPDRSLEARALLGHLAALRRATDRPLKIMTRRVIGEQ